MSELKAMEVCVPSARLWQAAVSGLFVLVAGACDEEDKGSSTESSSAQEHDEALSDKEIDALCKGMVDDAVKQAKSEQKPEQKSEQDTDSLCTAKVEEAKKAAPPQESDLPKLCGSMVESAKSQAEASLSGMKDKLKKLEDEVKAGKDELAALKEKARPLLLTTDEKTKSAEQKEYKFSELTSMCDKRGGYTQIHAACGGHNACAGFSYGDWGPGAAMLTEHSCTGVNGCLGLSCVELPKDSGRTGKELYEDVEFAEPLGSCGGCHGGYYDAAKKWQHDTSYFAVYVLKDSPRTAENWLDRTAAEQARLTAFGSRYTLADGTAIENMSAYHGVLSRAETERVVAHIRTLKPTIVTTKTVDPVSQ